MLRHFLVLGDCSQTELEQIIVSAINSKQRPGGYFSDIAKRKVLAMIFDKSSTRTRVSFSVGFSQLGGTSMFFSGKDLQIGRGEPIEDSARVISNMVDMIVIRTTTQERVKNFAENSIVPVINGLTNTSHPCQLLADIMTYMEMRGSISGKTVAFVGDGANNLCNSYLEAAEIFGFTLKVASPEAYKPSSQSASLQWFEDPQQAIENADLVVTDVWVSMGDEIDRQKRLKAFQPYQVNSELLDRASSEVLFLHCLPAHRGEEVDDNVLDDERSGVWQASTNRLHAQKALMEFLLQHKNYGTID